jgi:thiamine-monophosphate kinase
VRRYRKGPPISISEVGEFALIARILARLGSTPSVLLGPGDDAAVLAAPDGRAVLSVDLLVAGQHFDPAWSSAVDVGWRAAAANFADVAAMGARPTALLVGLAAPPDTAVAWVEGLAAGLAAACTAVGAAVVGGDVVASATLTVAVTAVGDLAGRPPVTRTGARPEDRVLVAGRLGWAAAGLAVLRAGDPVASRHPLLTAAHRRPDVRYDAAAILARHATAMVDVSDGLVADLGHIATGSGVGLELTAATLPIDAPVAAAGQELATDPAAWVAGGGDDHAFAATVPAGSVPTVRSAVSRLTPPCPLVEIGRVVVDDGLVWTDRQPPGPSGHEHFG